MNRKSIITSVLLSPGVVSDVPRGHEGNANPEPKAPTPEPWAKWVEMWQQLMTAVKGTQNILKKANSRDQTGVKEITIKIPVTMA